MNALFLFFLLVMEKMVNCRKDCLDHQTFTVQNTQHIFAVQFCLVNISNFYKTNFLPATSKANSHDQTNMTENWLEYDQKIMTTTNHNISAFSFKPSEPSTGGRFCFSCARFERMNSAYHLSRI